MAVIADAAATVSAAASSSAPYTRTRGVQSARRGASSAGGMRQFRGAKIAPSFAQANISSNTPNATSGSSCRVSGSAWSG